MRNRMTSGRWNSPWVDPWREEIERLLYVLRLRRLRSRWDARSSRIYQDRRVGDTQP